MSACFAGVGLEVFFGGNLYPRQEFVGAVSRGVGRVFGFQVSGFLNPKP